MPKRALTPQREAAGFAAVGLEGETLDQLAEREVQWWMRKATEFEGNVRPLSVLPGAALIEVQRHIDALQSVLGHATNAMVEELQRRDDLERKLKRMNAPDALLIRNVASTRLGEQRLSIDRLKEQHTVAFGDRESNALDQQVHRLAAHIKSGEWPERKAPSLVDLTVEQLEK